MGSRPRWRGRARWRSCSCGVVRAPVPAPPIQLESAHSGQPSGLAVPARSGREWNLLSPSCGDLPVGQFCVESRLQKYFGFHPPQITTTTSAIPSHKRGVSRSSRTRGGMRWTRQRFARNVMAGRVGERPVSDQQRADERCCSVRRSCVVLTPRRWRQVSRSRVGPTGLRQDLIRKRRWQTSRSPGRARRKPLKPLRAGTSGDSGVLVYSCAFYQYKVHARLRVQRASGVPHALFGRQS